MASHEINFPSLINKKIKKLRMPSVKVIAITNFGELDFDDSWI